MAPLRTQPTGLRPRSQGSPPLRFCRFTHACRSYTELRTLAEATRFSTDRGLDFQGDRVREGFSEKLDNGRRAAANPACAAPLITSLLLILFLEFLILLI
jgi:hypothetical protein